MSRRVSAIAAVLALFAAVAATAVAHAASPAPVHRARAPIESAPPAPSHRAQPATPQPVGHIPCDLYNAYHATPTPAVDDGAGQTIAIVDPYGTSKIIDDFKAFSGEFNLGGPPLVVSAPFGVDLNQSDAPPNPTWVQEIPLGVEWAHAIAPAAQIVLVEARTSMDTDLIAAIDYAVSTLNPDVLSMSWTFDESSYTASTLPSDSHFPAINGAHRAISYLAATGDIGPNPAWPAVSASVIAVGGTSVTPVAFGGQDTSSHTTCPTTGPFGVNQTNETAWSNTGGGSSLYVPKPSYQAGFASGSTRATPDVAMLADPNDGVAVYGGGQWFSTVLGGTSLASPMWAGLIARLNQAGGQHLSGVSWLYTTSAQPAKSTYVGLNDVIAGSSTYTPPPPGAPITISAGPGYDEVTGLGTPLWSMSITYFTWYDHISDAGFLNGSDNIHVVNANPSDTTVAINIPGQPGCNSGSVKIASGKYFIYSCPSGFGGPVSVTSSQRVVASQRVQYYQTFNEEKALPALNAAKSIVFTWYDHVSDLGFLNGSDNVHVVNPSSAPATVNVSVGSHALTPQVIQPGQESYFNYPGGYGGPVVVTADQPVLASQRVKYYQSFNEVPGLPTAGASTSLWFPWFDRVSDPGFTSDNVHVYATAGTTVTVHIPPCGDIIQPMTAGQVLPFTCASGFTGPVHVTSSGGVPVLATQRVKFNQTFNEVPAQSSTDAGTKLWLTWYDLTADGFSSDDVHVVNPGTVPLNNVQIQIPGCLNSIPAFSLAPGAETYRNCPGGLGGPVMVTADGPVLASGRVKYYASFNEVTAST